MLLLGKSLGFLAFYAVYLLVGGYIFNAIECPPEIYIKKKVASAVQEQEFEELLIHMSSYIDKFAKNIQSEMQPKLNHTPKFAKNIQNEMQPKLNHTPRYEKVEREDFECKTWSMYNSVFFAFTCITTIGYGTQTPTTQTGRGACIFYSSIGIPINSILIFLIRNFFRNQERTTGKKFPKCVI